MTSDAMRLALQCLGDRKIWRGRVRGLLGLINRSFVIESEGAMDGDVLVFRETLTFDDGAIEHRAWRLSDTPHGLAIDAEGVDPVRPGRVEDGELVFDYRVRFGGVAFAYRDWFRPLPGGRVENLGRAALLGAPVRAVSCRAEPG